MSRRRFAAIAALVVGAATLVLGVARGRERVPARPGRARLRRRRGGGRAWYGVLRRGTARVAGLAVAALALAGAVALLVADDSLLGELLVVGRAPGHAGGRACRRRRARGAARRAGPAAGRCCSSTRSRAAARRSASSSPTRRGRAGSSRSSSDRRGTSRRSCATRSPAAPTGSRWPAATARRRSSRRSPPSAACRTPASRRARATTSRSTSASTATTSSARSTRSSTAASEPGRPRRGQRARVRQQRLARALRRGGPARGLPRREAAHAARHRARRARPRRRRASTCAGPGRAGTSTSSGAAILVSNNRYRLGRAVGSGTRPRIDDGLLGITVVGDADRARRRRPAPSAAVARVVGARLRGRLRSPRPRRHRRRGARCSTRRCGFSIRPGVLRVRIARKHPGASPSAMAPDGVRAGLAELVRIARGRS